MMKYVQYLKFVKKCWEIFLEIIVWSLKKSYKNNLKKFSKAMFSKKMLKILGRIIKKKSLKISIYGLFSESGGKKKEKCRFKACALRGKKLICDF